MRYFPPPLWAHDESEAVRRQRAHEPMLHPRETSRALDACPPEARNHRRCPYLSTKCHAATIGWCNFAGMGTASSVCNACRSGAPPRVPAPISQPNGALNSPAPQVPWRERVRFGFGDCPRSTPATFPRNTCSTSRAPRTSSHAHRKRAMRATSPRGGDGEMVGHRAGNAVPAKEAGC